MTAPFGPPAALVRLFTQRFSATRRGARLARQLVLVELHDWGVPPASRLAADAGLVVAELAANAVTHGRVPGRDFELRMTLLESVLRVEVSDARADRRPVERPPADRAESGYGLRIVAAVAAGWGVADRVVGKTVWAELPVGDRSAGQVPPAGGLAAGVVRGAEVEGHGEVGGQGGAGGGGHAGAAHPGVDRGQVVVAGRLVGDGVQQYEPVVDGVPVPYGLDRDDPAGQAGCPDGEGVQVDGGVGRAGHPVAEVQVPLVDEQLGVVQADPEGPPGLPERTDRLHVPVLEDVPVDLGADARREGVPDGGHDPARLEGAEAPKR